MRATLAIGGSVLCLLSACATQNTPAPPALVYPSAASVDVVDNYHGEQVADPYRWLEEYSPATEEWIDEESRLTNDWLAAIPQRDAIRKRLTSLWDYERFSPPDRSGPNYFYSRNDGLQNQSVLYVTTSLGSDGRVLVDPNTFSADGTVALAGSFPSDDGSLLAYAVADAGSDWNVIKVRDVASGRDLSDEVRWVKFSPASWTKDGKGFYYARFDEPAQGADKLKQVNEFHKVYYHWLGTPQSADDLVYERRDHPQWYLYPLVSDDGRWLILQVEAGDSVNNALFYRDLSQPGSPIVELFNSFDAKYEFLGNDGTTFYVKSDLDAPRGRVWAIDVTSPSRSNWREIVAQAPDALVSASIVGNRLFCNYLHDARSVVTVRGLDGAMLGEVPLPGICTARGFGGRRSDHETFYATSGYTLPPAVWKFDLASGTSSVWRSPKVPFSGSKYVTEQIFATSKDGTRVPMFVTHRRDVRRDGQNPTLLYGYGGFNIPLTPSYSPVSAAWLDLGGIYVVANLRGGGEYGEDWHQGGMRLAKQNVFDDFIACAETLIRERYTSPKRLAIQGGSNGGLLVGACLTQRPDLYGACLAAVGVLDMLRFQKFTIGWGWVGDYGSSDNPDEFKALYAYSPYHQVLRQTGKGICYPPTLITTADHDDRVYPAHSFKFAAALQAAQTCLNPVLIRIDRRAGHGAGKPTSKRIDEVADEYAFLVKELGMRVN